VSVEHIGKAPGLPLRGREPGGPESVPRGSRFSASTPTTNEDDGARGTLLRAETGRLPSLLDTREQPAQTEEKAKSRLNERARRKQETIEAIERGLSSGEIAGVKLDDRIPHAIPTLEGWQGRLSMCGQEATHHVCPNDNHHIVKVNCCRVPSCPHQEARNAKRWTMRAEQMMKYMKNGDKWATVSSRLLKMGVELPQEQPPGDAKMGWKLVTLATKKAASLVDDIENQFDLRKAFMRFLKRRYGVVAAFSSIEVGSGGNAHLHSIIYGPFIPRSEIQHWFQSRDCDLPGCKHVPGDRNCRGSWAVDIRAAFDPREALKYACSPDAKNMNRAAFAELRLLTYLVLYKRHRIETYGLAKPGAWKNVDLVDTVLDFDFCPYCGCQMIAVEFGKLVGHAYRWGAPSRAGP
jgi:hypothetical protein